MTNGDDKPWLEEVQPEEGDGGFVEKYRPQIILVGVVVLVAFLGLIFYAYQSGKNGAPPEPPLVSAPDGPIREKPEDPGGIDIPDRDKLVYNRVSGEDVEDDGVTLEPGPELPEELPAEASAASAATEPEPLEGQAEKPADEPVAETVEAAEAPAEDSQPAAADGNFMIQLGAFGSRESAERAWETLKGKHGEVLGPLAPDYEPLKRAGGTLYRLRAGGFADRPAAEDACAKLKAAGQGCFPAER